MTVSKPHSYRSAKLRPVHFGLRAGRQALQKAKAEAEISIDFPTESDAEAMVRALVPEIAAPRTSRTFIRVTRRGKATKIVFYARDLVALRAMVNSFLRFASVWRKLSEALNIGDNSARRTRKSTTQKQDEYLV